MSTIPKPARAKSWQGKAVIHDIIDGDTFRAAIDLGFRISLTAPIRIRGIQAPELPTDAGVDAKNYLARLLPAGTIVTLTSRRLDLHGRAEAEVELPDGRDLATLLIESGRALPANTSGDIIQK